MKPTARLRSYLAIAGSSLLAISYSHAATLYWDGTTSTANADGGAGAWNGTDLWDTLAMAGVNATWASGDFAVFGGTASALVTTGGPITTSGIQFNTTGYTITADSTNTLSFTGASNIIFNNIAAAMITGTVTGGGSVTLSTTNPATAGTLTLNGTSATGWTGTTTINPGMTLSLAGLNQGLVSTIGGITLKGGNILLTNTATGAENTIDRVNNTAAITSYGSGSILIANTSTAGRQYSETIGSITHNNGQLSLGFTTVQNGTAPSTQTLIMGGLTRSGTATIGISGGGSGGGNSIHANSEIRVTGITTSTAANEIIGPWMTAGNATNAQSDWAVYVSDGISGRVQSRAIAASAQTTWTSSLATGNYTAANANPLTSTVNNRLTANRFVNTLRATFAESNATSGTIWNINTATDTIAFGSHALIDGDVVSFRTAPTGLTDYRPYYVINSVAGTSFQLSLTPGGGLLDLTTVQAASSFMATGLNLNGNTLGMNGYITGTTGSAAIGGGSASTITLPTTTSGNLYLHGANNIWIDPSIKDNGAGILTLVKASPNTVTLSGTNTYTGGTVINGGTIAVTSDSHLGATTGGVTFDGTGTLSGAVTYNASRTFTVNNGAIASITGAPTIAGQLTINNGGFVTVSGAATISGQITGTGTLAHSDATTLTLSNTNNTFTGSVLVSGSGSISYASLAAGSSLILNSGTLLMSPTTVSNPQILLAGTGTISNSAATALTTNSNISPTGNGARTLNVATNLGGRINLSGNLTDNDGAALTLNVNSLSTNGGLVGLSGTNTYSGTTTINTGSNAGNPGQYNALVIQGMQALSANTSITFARGNSGTLGLNLLHDGSVTKLVDVAYPTSGSPTFFVGNNNVMNGGTSAGTNTGETIELRNLILGTTALTYNIIGNNGYRLKFNDVNLPTVNGAVSATFNPTGAPLTIAGTVRQASSANTGAMTLGLGGTNSGNLISGSIKNSADGSPRLLTLSKSGSSIWTVSGTNDYTGGTNVSGGILRITGNSSAANGAVAVSGGFLGGNNGGSLGGAVTVSSTGGIHLADGSVGNLNLGSTLTATGAAGANNFFFDLASGGSTTDQIVVSGAFNMNTGGVTNTGGAVVVNVNQLGGTANRLTAGTYDILTAPSGTALAAANGGYFRLATTKAFGQTFSLSNSTSTILKLTTTHETGVVLANTTLSGSNASWATAGNYSGTAVPDYASNVIINSAIGTSPLNGDRNINSLTYETLATTATTITAGTPAGMLVIEAGAVNGNTAGNGISLKNASGTHRIDANIGLASSQTWTMVSGSSLDMRGAISDFGANVTLTKAGAGTLDLSNAASNASWYGTLAVTNGIVRTGSGNTATIGSGNLTLNGGVLYGTNALSVTRTLGADFGQIQITGGVSGFSEDGFSSGTVNFGGLGLTVAWGSTYFNPSSLVLLTSGVQSNGPATIRNASITFANGLDLNGANRSVQVNQIDNTILGLGATMSGAISNSSGTPAGFIKDGVGRLTLTGTNTYNGGTTINGGTLRFNSLLTMPASGAVSVQTGATLGVRVGAANEWTTGTSGVGTIGGLLAGLGGRTGSTVSYTGNVGLEFIMTGEQIYSGTIANVGTTLSVATYGTNGVLALSGPNTYSGGTFLNGGSNGATGKALGATLVINAANNLGNASGALTFRGGILGIDGTTLTSLSGLGRTVTFTSGMDVGFDIVNSANTFTVGQVLNQVLGDLYKAGQGTLVLDQNNTYTGGTIITGGILRLDKTGSGALASTSALSLGGGEFSVLGNTSGATTQTLAGFTMNAGNNRISLDPNGGTSTILTLGNAWTRNAGSSLLIDYSSASSGIREVRTALATTTYVLSNGIYGGILVKDSGGVGFATRAAGSNIAITRYDDTTGTTLADNSNTAATNFTTLNTVYSAGTLNWNNGITTRSVNSLTIDTTNNGGTIDMGVSTNVLTLTSLGILFKGTNDSILQGGTVGASASEVIVHQTSATNTLTINSPISAAAGSLTKDGVGTLIVGGTNVYTGATRVNDGTLALGASNVFAVTAFSIGNATLNAATFADTVGTLDPTAGATINFGIGGALAFADSNAVDWSGGALNLTGNLDFSGTINSSLRFGTTAAGLTAAQLARISASGWTGFALNASGYLTATPSGSGPEIAVEQPVATNIANNGSKAFGTVTIGSNNPLTFTIRNTGPAALNLLSSPAVIVGGANPGDFTVTAVPTTPVTSGGGTTTFTVQFAPSASGARNATLTIANNDSDEGSFVINVSGTGQTAYQAWATGSQPFNGDANGDGVKDGLAFLLGAPTPGTNAIGLLPTVTQSGGNLVLTFNCLPVAARGSAQLRVAYSNSLASWTATTNVVPNTPGGADPGGVVNFAVVAGPVGPPALNTVTATINVSAAGGGKLFGRLQATE